MKLKYLIIIELVITALSLHGLETYKIKVSTNPKIDGFVSIQQPRFIQKKSKDIKIILNEVFTLQEGWYGFFFENNNYIGYVEEYIKKDTEIILNLTEINDFNIEFKNSNYYKFREKQLTIFALYLLGGIFPITNLIGTPYYSDFTLTCVLYYPYIMVPYGIINISNFITGVSLLIAGLNNYYKYDRNIGEKLLVGSSICIGITYIINLIYCMVWASLFFKNNSINIYDYLKNYRDIEKIVNKKNGISFDLNITNEYTKISFIKKI